MPPHRQLYIGLALGTLLANLAIYGTTLEAVWYALQSVAGIGFFALEASKNGAALSTMKSNRWLLAGLVMAVVGVLGLILSAVFPNADFAILGRITFGWVLTMIAYGQMSGCSSDPQNDK